MSNRGSMPASAPSKRVSGERNRVTLLVTTLMRLLCFTLLAVCLPAAAFAQHPASTTLKVGDTAPDFTLPSTDGSKVHLADYLGKGTVVLAFFPAAFTGG